MPITMSETKEEPIKRTAIRVPDFAVLVCSLYNLSADWYINYVKLNLLMIFWLQEILCEFAQFN